MTTSGYEHQEGDAFQIGSLFPLFLSSPDEFAEMLILSKVAWHKPWIAMNVPPQRFDKRLSGSVCSLM